jgi:hypothetical protein
MPEETVVAERESAAEDRPVGAAPLLPNPGGSIPDHRSSGYASLGYAESVVEFGRLVELPASGGWLQERKIDGTVDRDLIGCYPLFDCPRWWRLEEDLASLSGRFVSATVVPDPLAGVPKDRLARAFDVVRFFKLHFVVDFGKRDGEFPSRHHRARVRRALRRLEVDVGSGSPLLLDEWCRLHAVLADRKKLSGIHLFSRNSFRRQLDLPGLVSFRAVDARGCQGIQLWLESERGAHSHLLALSTDGYRVGAAYALHDAALRYFRGRVRRLDLGGGAGSDVPENDGLARFKSGWANDSLPSFACGRVLCPEVYEALTRRRGRGETFFPAYRGEELARTEEASGGPAR